MSVNPQQVPRRAGPRPRGLEKARRAPAATGTRGRPNERTFPCAACEDNENLAQTLRNATPSSRGAERPRARKATDEQVAEAYARHGSVWKAAEELGMCGQSVHERLARMGVDTSRNPFTAEDEGYLRERYVIYRDAGMLQVLADEMGRTKHLICRKAGEMGLTDPKRKARYARVWLGMPESALKEIWEQFKRSRRGVKAFCGVRHYDVQSFTDAMRRCFPDEYDDVVASKTPRSRGYARGRDFEYAVRDDMRRHGYLALRSPASKSPADLYCIKRDELVFVQCKLHGVLPPGEWNEFLEYCESVSAAPVMARRPEGGRGVEYFLIRGPKDGSHRRQPMEPWKPSERERSQE